MRYLERLGTGLAFLGCLHRNCLLDRSVRARLYTSFDLPSSLNDSSRTSIILAPSQGQCIMTRELVEVHSPTCRADAILLLSSATFAMTEEQEMLEARQQI